MLFIVYTFIALLALFSSLLQDQLQNTLNFDTTSNTTEHFTNIKIREEQITLNESKMQNVGKGWDF